jgi:hypothetical protein
LTYQAKTLDTDKGQKMITVKILPNIARWYGHETDIDWMPQTAGKHTITPETFRSWLMTMKSDLDRETGQGYNSEDRQYWLIASLRRQIANMEKVIA